MMIQCDLCKEKFEEEDFEKYYHAQIDYEYKIFDLITPCCRSLDWSVVQNGTFLEI